MLTTSKHPPSLKIYFATEMWERYGFYVVQTLLALYLTLHFHWDDGTVYPLVGAFTALTYLSPVVGGWIADHLIGQKRSVLLGTLILFISYIAMGAMRSDNILILSLAGIAVGTGLVKPNISSLLGNEYLPGSPKRERGFTIFYMGITAGIIIGTTLPSYLVDVLSWGKAFQSATIGMIFAFVVFLYGIWRYNIKDYSPFQFSLLNIIYALLLIGFMWYGAYFVLFHAPLANILFSLIAILSIIYLVNAIKQESPQQARQTMVIGLLCLISVMFWAFYFQMFLSLTLFLKRVAQPTLLGLPFPPPYYVAVQSLGMIIFGLFLARHQKSAAIDVHAKRVGNKFLLSMVFMSCAYAFILGVCYSAHGPHLLSPWLFIPAYLLISIAELLLSPIGLSAISLLAQDAKVSTMMGIFFVSLGLGGFLSGKLALMTALPQVELDKLSIVALKSHYAETFTHLFVILLLGTSICFGLNLLIKRLIKPVVN